MAIGYICFWYWLWLPNFSPVTIQRISSSIIVATHEHIWRWFGSAYSHTACLKSFLISFGCRCRSHDLISRHIQRCISIYPIIISLILYARAQRRTLRSISCCRRCHSSRVQRTPINPHKHQKKKLDKVATFAGRSLTQRPISISLNLYEFWALNADSFVFRSKTRCLVNCWTNESHGLGIHLFESTDFFFYLVL